MLGANVATSHIDLGTVRSAGARILQGVCALVLLALIAGLLAALLPRPFGFRPAVVTSGSMGHSVPVGSLAITHVVGAAGVHQGDVILVREQANGVNASPKLHRVVQIDRSNGNILVTTRGDANAAPDPNSYVLPARVDVMAYSIPFLGYLVGFMLTPGGWLIAVGLPGALVCAFVLRRIWASDTAPPSLERGTARFTRRPAADLMAEIDRASFRRQPAAIVRLPRSLMSRVPRPSLVVLAVVLIAVTASATAAAGYVMAPRPHANTGDGRLAREAASLAQFSAGQAARDGYAADLLLLGDAGDPAIRSGGLAQRQAALSRLLGSPSNVFDSLAMVDLSGRIVASTDPTIVDANSSAAFRFARANGSAGSSIDVPGSPAAIDFAAPITAPNGVQSGVLLARTTAQRIWAPTLGAAVDGSRNVIVDAHGTLIASAPADDLGHAWNAAPARLGGLDVSLGGTPSACGSSTIGAGTHLDMGWRVASCLPDSPAATASTTSPGRNWTRMGEVAALVAAAVLIASTVLYVAARPRDQRPSRRGSAAQIVAIETRLAAIEALLHEREA